MYESTRARIKYQSGTKDEENDSVEIRNGFSTSLGRVKIISDAEFLRNTSYYVKEWSLFALAYFFITVLPFYVWINFRSTLETVSQVKKLKK